MQHIWTVIIPFLAPGGSICAPAWESGPFRQTVLQTWESSRVLDEAVQLQNSGFPGKSRTAWPLLLKLLVLIYKHGSHFVQGSCPGWVVGGSMPRVETILLNTLAAML